METKDWINIIQQASLIIAATFGIIAAATETKDKDRNITKWGKIAITGIIITTLFSITNEYLKQRKSKADELASQKKEIERIEKENAEYIQNIQFLDSILTTSNKALHNQIDLQDKNKTLLDNINHSIKLQNLISKSNDTINTTVKANLVTQQKTYLKSVKLDSLQEKALLKQSDLLNQQQAINNNINRSLNPLLPFAIQYSIKLKPTEKADEEAGSYAFSQSWEVYSNIRKMIKKRTKDEQDWSFSSRDYPGVFTQHKRDTSRFSFDTPPYAYVITPNFKGFYDFKNGETLDLNFCLSSPDDYGRNCEFQAIAYTRSTKMDENYIVHDDNSYGIYLLYLVDTEELEIFFYSDEIRVDTDFGKFKSLIDLEGAYIYADMAGLPIGAEFNSMRLFFGPNYARSVDINLKEKGKTTVKYDVLRMSNKIDSIN